MKKQKRRLVHPTRKPKQINNTHLHDRRECSADACGLTFGNQASEDLFEPPLPYPRDDVLPSIGGEGMEWRHVIADIGQFYSVSPLPKFGLRLLRRTSFSG